MSGHSKWHKVKHQKAAKDPKRGKLFTQLSKQVRIAAKEGGPDPDMNASLRKAIEDAKAANMPKENIQRAIEKGAGIGDAGNLEEFTLEGYGPGGVAIMLAGSTDNKNRTVAEVRNLFKSSGGSLGEPGSAAYVFGNDPDNPTFMAPLDDETKPQFEKLIEELEEYEDIDDVYHNAEV